MKTFIGGRRAAALIFIVLQACAGAGQAACVEKKIGSDFKYDGKPIHPGCIEDLAAELNGDTFVGSITMGYRPRVLGERGCDNSNRHSEDFDAGNGSVSYRHEDGSTFAYRHIRQLRDDLHLLEVDVGTSGSLSYADLLIVRYSVEPVFNVTAEGVTVRQADRLTRVSEADLSSSEQVPALPLTDETFEKIGKAYDSLGLPKPDFCPGSK